MDELLIANAVQLLDHYASSFFNIEVDELTRPYSHEKCPHKQMSLEDFANDFEPADDHIISDAKPIPDYRVTRNKKAAWRKYKFDTICLPQKHVTGLKDFQKIKDSPLLPQKCSSLLDEYTEPILENTVLLYGVLTECARELPKKYPTSEALQKASLGWIENRYNHQRTELEPKAAEITKYLRDYFTVDKLL